MYRRTPSTLYLLAQWQRARVAPAVEGSWLAFSKYTSSEGRGQVVEVVEQVMNRLKAAVDIIIPTKHIHFHVPLKYIISTRQGLDALL